MRLTRIHIVTILLLLGLCRAVSSGSDQSKASGSQKRAITSADEGTYAYNDREQLKTESSDASEEEQKEEEEEQPETNLPILPPIILLDFGNGTEEDNLTSDEKAKRTVNNGLGYGYDRNALHSRKYNYYFPAGKTGTTVSIEESISPFLPKTIIEKAQPNNGASVAGRSFAPSFHRNQFRAASPGSYSHAQSSSKFQYVNPEYSAKSQSAFGLRTRLEKAPTNTYFNSYQSFASTPQPPPSPYNIRSSAYRGQVGTTTAAPSLEYSPTEEARYVTASPLGYVNSPRSTFSYGAPSAFPRHPATANSESYPAQRQNGQSSANLPSFASQSQAAVESSTVSPLSQDSRFSRPTSQVSDTPRYTVENGVRYENKIFWKYPDGRISDSPPPTYVETYSGLPQSSGSPAERPRSPSSIYETSAEETGVHSQGPVQFPVVPETGAQEPSPFISSESLSSSLPQQQVYRLGYQTLLTQKQNGNLAQQARASNRGAPSYSYFAAQPTSSPVAGSKASARDRERNYTPSTYLRSQQASKYMINSPNPEYVDSYTTEPSPRSTTHPTSLFTASAGANANRQSVANKALDSYSNIRYSDLLSYNPSISQYIKNPSSILNVHPTFVQTGNSLIPVIILRVDGASPVQPKVTPNINLKALLQQYLLQYANSVQDLARPSSYDLGSEASEKSQGPGGSNSHILDFLRFAQNEGGESPGYTPEQYIGRSSYATSNLDHADDFPGNKYGERLTSRQKVKSVQIVDDPRYTTYKIRN